jgi:osmoprotectant transport system permease protein
MNWVMSNTDLIWQLSLAHVALSVPPVVLGLLVSVPVSWFTVRNRAAGGPLLIIAGLIYTVPALPLLIAIPALLSTRLLDPANVVVALTLYAVALLTRSTSDALLSVDSDAKEAADAVGYSTWRRFWQVELPLAGPVILSGLRVVSVSTVSLVSLGSIIGVSSLGYLFLNGLQRNITAEVWTGIVMSVAIAVVFDALLVLTGRMLMPWVEPARRRVSSFAPEVRP